MVLCTFLLEQFKRLNGAWEQLVAGPDDAYPSHILSSHSP